MHFKSKHFELQKLKDGIYAAIAKDGGGSVGNAGFVDLGDQTIVFDTFNTQQAAEDLQHFAESITGQSVTWVINSHWHGDHVRGNQIFKDSHIISSSTTYQKMKELHPERIAKQKNDIKGLLQFIESLIEKNDIGLENQIRFLKEIATSLPSLELVLPHQTFNSKVMFHGSKRQAELFTLGGGHSFCDAILYLPDDKVIFMGDLLFVDTHPSLFEESNPENWIRILNEAKKMEIDIAVPGHGPVGAKHDMKSLMNYINKITTLVKENRNLDELSIPPKFQKWSASENFIRNLKLLKENSQGIN
ncbi:MBL fold metallo-hydrolase [Bacillus sp. FJAT-49736]|uniref:MBL fold metallo-hydrolase n=1 Tax=Bacillus sp. FJAT-49736 TaxID=2833582 RepID=UPI002016A620|nr:MBL fold metallo-hydrolase [Bacillus sp. FJAT-49736]